MDDKNVDKTPSDIVIIIRPSLKRACCDGDACRAAIFNQLLYCIAWKRKYEKDYWFGSYEEIHTKLLDESWGLSKVIKEVKVLVEEGFIEQRRNPAKGWDQTRQYLFGEEQAKKFRETCEKAKVCIEHQIGFPPDVIHLLKSTNAIAENNKCICSIQQIDSVELTNASVKNNDAIPKTPTKTTRKREGENERPSTHSIDQSSSQKPDVTGYLRVFMRKFLLEMGATDTLLEEHLMYIQSLFYASGLDKATFRFEAEKAVDRTRQVDSDLRYFYECFLASLGIPMPKGK